MASPDRIEQTKLDFADLYGQIVLAKRGFWSTMTSAASAPTIRSRSAGSAGAKRLQRPSEKGGIRNDGSGVGAEVHPHGI